MEGTLGFDEVMNIVFIRKLRKESLRFGKNYSLFLTPDFVYSTGCPRNVFDLNFEFNDFKELNPIFLFLRFMSGRDFKSEFATEF